ncbi:nuclear pore complex protein NUP98B-like isoform X2 [Solanum dulcamara]|uniref:nuclear pore complex protein NUP98B-like isoform X2 n=2 Tax=Solanum dulcamara TaxID=45834 RepID=UPI00248549A9|nr:nuclear pore complex protein NUP98B-like isoform X2 [Solanum dulcamara]
MTTVEFKGYQCLRLLHSWISKTAFGVPSNSHFGPPRFDSYSFGQPAVSMSGSKGTLAFNATMNATSGQTQNVSSSSSTLSTFGKRYDVNSVANEPLVWSRDVNASDSSILGYPRAPEFGISSNSHFGTSRSDSYSFGQPAKKKVHHLFSRALVLETQHLASYIATPENYIPGSGGKIQSICGMQTYKDKSQEELRFEDYQLGDKVTFYKPFSFVDSTDIVLMIIGTIATIGNGLSLPNMTVLFGEWTDSFGQNQNNKDALGVSLKFVYLALGCGAGAFLCFSNKESLSETI